MKKLLTILSILVVSSCTEVMVMLPEPTPIESDRIVLIEELTGVDCPNCPSGASILAGLLEKYEGNVVGVSIHGNFLATPLSTSRFDFRSDLNDDLENFLKPWFGKPAAVINRIQQMGQTEFAVSNIDLWSQFVEEELSKDQTAAIAISHEYNPETRALDIEVEVEPWVDLSGDIRISVMLTESHVIDAQKDQSVIIPDYEHNHMLKTMLTAFDGDGLASEMTAFQPQTKNYSYTLPVEEDLWIAENMEIIAFVSLVTPNTKEVLQAGIAHIIE